MMSEIMESIRSTKIIAIVRNAECDIAALAGALYRGGIRMIEVTFNQAHPEQWSKTARDITRIATALPGVLPGAGTVLTLEQLHMAYDAGARYIISPNVDVDIIEETKRLGLISLPGAMTPSEIVRARDAGSDAVKLFPAGTLGPGYLKAVRAPLSHIPLLAVGGIKLENAAAFLNAGAIGLGIGGNLVNSPDDHAQTEATARAYVEAVKG